MKKSVLYSSKRKSILEDMKSSGSVLSSLAKREEFAISLRKKKTKEIIAVKRKKTLEAISKRKEAVLAVGRISNA